MEAVGIDAEPKIPFLHLGGGSNRKGYNQYLRGLCRAALYKMLYSVGDNRSFAASGACYYHSRSCQMLNRLKLILVEYR